MRSDKVEWRATCSEDNKHSAGAAVNGTPVALCRNRLPRKGLADRLEKCPGRVGLVEDKYRLGRAVGGDRLAVVARREEHLEVGSLLLEGAAKVDPGELAGKDDIREEEADPGVVPVPDLERALRRLGLEEGVAVLL